MKMAGKLLLYLIVPLVGILLFLSVLFYNYSASLYLDEAKSNIEKLTNFLLIDIDQMIDRANGDMDIMLANRTLDEYAKYSALDMLDLAEDARWRTERDFLKVMEEKKNYQTLQVIGLQGRSFIDISEGKIIYRHHDYGDDIWFKEVLGDLNRTSFTSSIHEGNEHAKPSLFVSRLGVDENGKPLAILTLHMYLENLFAEMTQIHVGQKGYAYLIDSSGIIVAHPLKAMLGKQSIHLESTQKVLLGERGIVIETGQEGNAMLTGYAPTRITGLYLILTQPYNEALASLQQLKLFSVLMILISSLLLFFIIFILSRKMTKPLSELSQSAEAIAGGDLERALSPQVLAMKDETGDLAASFERMREAILQREAALKASEESYRTLFENLPQKIFLKDTNSVYVSCNENYAKEVAIASSEIRGKTDFDFYPAELARQYRDDDRRVMESGVIEDIVKPYIVQGVSSYVHTVIVPVKNKSGENVGILEIFWDVTEQHRIAMELERTLERLNEAQQIAHIGTWELDIVRQTLWWSQEVYRIFDQNPDTFSKTYEAFLETVHPDDVAQVRESLSDALKNYTPYRIDHRIITREGMIKTVHEEGRINFKEDDEAYRMVGTVQDVTKQRQDEAHILKLLDELQQFNFITSHNLQEPLRRIVSFTQLLAKRYHGQLDSDADEFIGYIVSSTQKMQIMINELLVYTRIETRGKHFVRIDTDALVQKIIAGLSERIETKGAKVIVGTLPVIEADREQFVLLISNLLENGIIFNRSEKPEVNIRCERDGAWWRFAISDNGIGIEEKLMPQLFNVFKRLVKEEEFPGIGMGLAIAKRIVERHGGRIWAVSEAGKGSTFFFTFRAVEAENVTDE